MHQGLFKKGLFMSGLLCLITAPLVFANTDNNDKLKQVEQKIKQQQQQIKQQLAQKNDLELTLKSLEFDIAQLAVKQTQTNNDIRRSNNKINQLNGEQDQLNADKKKHQSLLAQMIKTAYVNGKHDYSKLLLNQESPAQLERLIIYYQNLQDSRIEQLQEIKQVLERLAEVEVELKQKHAELNESKQQQKQQNRQLVLRQRDRKGTLNKINRTIRNNQQKLKSLEADRERLTTAIANAKAQATRNPASLAGLYNLKKQLKWPSSGRISHKYGQRRSGALRWKGVMIEAELGERVNAVADGIVLYSNWLKGFGWLTVIDHGKGYMSLYGHNQALLKQAGEYVETNEPIALAGQSGGQSQPGLYFEIRYQGKTVNPARWCR